jgi:transposase
MLSEDQILEIQKLKNFGISNAEIAYNMEISVGSVYKYANLAAPILSNSALYTQQVENSEQNPIPKLLEPYTELISDLLRRKVYNSSKVYQNLVTAGFKGSYVIVNDFIRKKERERYPNRIRIYQKVETEPGEQAQVDWGYFGKIKVNGDITNLYAFVYVLSYSRAMFAKFVTSQKQRTFQECHVQAFKRLGIPKRIRYDNVKTVVISRKRTEAGGEYIVYNFDFSNFARYYNFEVEICPPYYPQSKGKVESGVKYLRKNFWNGEKFKKTFNFIDELNNKLTLWLNSHANNRIHSTTRERPVDRWNKEKQDLFIIDNFPAYQNCQLSSRRASQNSMVTYKRSAYWVPQEFARRKIDIKEIDNGGMVKLEFQFKGKKIIEYPFASKIGSWILPKDNSMLLNKKRQKLIVREKIWNIEVQKSNLEYYDKFIN